MNTTELKFRSNMMLDVIALYKATLCQQYDEREINGFLMMLSEWILGWDTVRYMTSKREHINQSDLLKFHWALEDLKKERPIQHIIGQVTFCGCQIAVNGDVLIPRPETEEIVKKTVNLIHQPQKIADICCGSGCIGIALKTTFPESEVTAIDCSFQALETAKANAETNGISICYKQADVLKDDPLEGMYDIIISNPPYIRESEKAEMRANVLNYEPEIALFVKDEDPLIFYRKIAQLAQTHLAEHGVLVFEINEREVSEMKEMLTELGYQSTLEKDFREAPRMIIARKKLRTTQSDER